MQTAWKHIDKSKTLLGSTKMLILKTTTSLEEIMALKLREIPILLYTFERVRVEGLTALKHVVATKNSRLY
jgi:hypothetical protein